MALPSPSDPEQANMAVQAVKTLRGSLMNGGIEIYVALADENAKLKEMNEKLNGDVESLTRQIANMVHALSSRRKLTNHNRSAKLNKLFSSVKALAEAHFGSLPSEVRSNPALWDNFRGHSAVKKIIPLPMSDSAVAKQMRIGAFLAVLASELERHLFHPTYLLSDGTELNNLLDDAVKDYPEEEANARAALLRLGERSPERINSVLTSRILAVMRRVIEHVLDLIPEGSKSAFERELKDFCKAAAEQWTFIQRLDARIDLEYVIGHARPLFSDRSDHSSPDTGHNGKHRPNGTSNQAANNNKSSNSNGKKPATAAPQSDNTATTALTGIEAVVVWPDFYDYISDETLVQGYLLTAGQLSAAKAEEKALQQPSADRRRRSRTSRTLSFSGAGNRPDLGLNLNGQAAAAQNGAVASSSVSGSSSASFLSRSSGGGRKVA
ncbi:hypothetical protein C7999DRAFT_13140 [Corynascus novoguineensis]|uniref:Uncharacterized protein n=1 Tax=Corynascus novoguineensis TaxID=1126955 RepID=A0AAN7CV64_9PEZI|nr:hypothetical protein C7999DRAFT_13140 [Corynascus novoguineensis]